MTLVSNQFCRILLVTALIVTCTANTAVFAQGKTVTPAELRDAIRKSAETRQKNLDQVRSFFADPQIRAAIAKGGISYERVQKAVSALDADALERLASQTSKIQSDFAAGSLSNQELTYIVIALGAAVIVLIAVAA